ncbi:guanitoxin biosynthesis heme-dependent pre-guanitoxin N-hydroxylase GntA [Maribacter sp. LLG6340-A2]|uniref:guanitoxin biosynthesis heme-dependent pre-guanitoxin N-hydroxylase GntA n=1 Tax=Maribacter sp. LLG6340-A2 TaxID=3160834 RepID=UPI0038661031
MELNTIDSTITTDEMVREFILDDHPCVMAQSLVANDNLTIHNYSRFSFKCIPTLLEDLYEYLNEIDDESKKFQTFIAVFEDDEFESELAFENALWKLLYQLHKEDYCEWDKQTDSDVSSSNFSMSILGNSFYIVGMHPNASRKARSSPVPMIVFNLHNQFEILRKSNRYTRVRDLIRSRDEVYQGSINPMLEDFGTNSEARQYSGRAVDNNWKCPYQFNKK